MKGRFGTYDKGDGVLEVKIGTNQNFRAGRGPTYQYEHMIPSLSPMRTMVASGDEVESSREMVETWRGWNGPKILIWLSSTHICIYPVKNSF
jgi:hypothetical protein